MFLWLKVDLPSGEKGSVVMPRRQSEQRRPSPTYKRPPIDLLLPHNPPLTPNECHNVGAPITRTQHANQPRTTVTLVQPYAGHATNPLDQRSVTPRARFCVLW